MKTANGHFCPDYYSRFSCAASACKESCCAAGWEIPIDGAAYEKYARLVPGFEDNVRTDTDGDIIFRQKSGGECVYFRDDGLCNLYVLTGFQCEICTKYPRFFEEYDGFTEAGLSLSCEAAEKIILEYRENPYTEIGARTTDDRLLELLVKSRAKALESVFSGEDPDRALEYILGFSSSLQEIIDSDRPDKFDKIAAEPFELFSAGEVDEIKSFICERTEVLSEEWKNLLREKVPESRNGSLIERRNYLGYLIYRYFLKAINTGDIYGECLFIAALYCLANALPCEFGNAVRMISREIEHNEGNTRAILEFLAG